MIASLKNYYNEILANYKNLRNKNIKEKLLLDNLEYNKEINIAIIVPYRNNKYQNRQEQLNHFIDYYYNFIDNVDIYIIEQSEDGKKFNRGCLLNCGFDIAKKEKKYSMFIFHDVDLISPNELKNIYTYESNNPIHIASLWKEKYIQKDYFGGITSFSQNAYEKINGYPNNFYGWGGENDAVYNRLIINNMSIYFIETNKNISIKELEYNKTSGIIDLINMHVKYILLKDINQWNNNGLSNLVYNINNITNIKYNNVKKYNIEI